MPHTTKVPCHLRPRAQLPLTATPQCHVNLVPTGYFQSALLVLSLLPHHLGQPYVGQGNFEIITNTRTAPPQASAGISVPLGQELCKWQLLSDLPGMASHSEQVWALGFGHSAESTLIASGEQKSPNSVMLRRCLHRVC